MVSKTDKYQIQWGNAHSVLLAYYIQELEVNHIRYFILRNYEGLPQKNNSKDVDIVIEPKKHNAAKYILIQAYHKFGFLYIHIVKYERARCFYGMNLVNNQSIHIDLIAGYLHKGFELFPFDELYLNTKEYNGFKVLNVPYDALMLLFYKVIGSKQLKNSYKEKISSIYREEQNQIDSTLIRILGNSKGKEIAQYIKTQDYDSVISNSSEISKMSKVRSFFKTPVKTLYRIIQFFLEKIIRIVICPRKFQNFIAVLGADGTGKSTFIDGLINQIAFYYTSDSTKCHIYHHRPTVLPNLGAIGEKSGVMKADTDFTNPHRGKPTGFISSLLRMTYYWLDYAIGVPTKLRKDVQFDKFTIYDRYIYDFLIDPKRTRVNLPYWLRLFFIKLVSQPRIVFILTADAKTIYKRKQELTVEEINRQLGELTKLAKTDKRFVVIDANQSPDKMVDDAIKVILDRFTHQIK